MFLESAFVIGCGIKISNLINYVRFYFYASFLFFISMHRKT